MVDKESVQVESSSNLVDQNGLDGGKSVADSPTIRAEVHDDIFDMEDVGEVKGTKRQRTDEEASVRIIFSSLPRSSKKKLDELLNSWSEWHSRNCSLEKDPLEPIEYGEQTYFPAIHLGVDKVSSVSVWMDSQVRKRQCKEPLTLDNSSTPLYDRDYSLGLTPEAEANDEKSAQDLRNASRCFNCGSYGHSLRECAKPHNHAAVSSARKELLQSKKNKNSGPRIQTRYYQDSPGGKYDGLKPGCLSAETRELLGLKDLQPPPWLSRMRQLGYPPGYLDSEEEDQPSGIEIFGDEEANDDSGDEPKPNAKVPKRKTIDFPGINSPMPKNADPKAWEEEVQASPSKLPCPQPYRFNRLQSPSPPENWNGHAPPLSQNYIRLPPLHYNYSSPPPLSFSRPNSFYEPFSPPGVPIPGSPGNMAPHFRSGSEPFSPPGVPIPRSPASMIPHFGPGNPPNSFMYHNSWHSSA